MTKAEIAEATAEQTETDAPAAADADTGIESGAVTSGSDSEVAEPGSGTATEPAGSDSDTEAGTAKSYSGAATGSDPVTEKAVPEKAKGSGAESEPVAKSKSKSGAESKSAAKSEPAAESEPRSADNPRWWTSIRVVAGAAVVALVAALTFGVLWATDDSADQLAALQGRLDTEAAAEAAASRYAMSVSEVDFRDLGIWRTALTEGASEQLSPKLEAAVDVVGPWLTKMEYTATARLLAARVAENDGDRFVVQVFVDMTSKSKQTPDGVAATATYTVTMDRASNWTITDVGGVGGALPGAGAPAPAPAGAGR